MNSSLKKKSAARLRAVQYLYQHFLRPELTADMLLATEAEEVDTEGMEEEEMLPIAPDAKLLRGIVQGAIMQEAEIGARLKKIIPSYWTEDKLPALFRAILLAAGYELVYHPQLATNIILNEYVGVTADFADEQETALLNGVLQEAVRGLRPAGMAHG